MEVIISHAGADFDALASMVAAGKLYPQARLYFTASPDGNVREFLSLYKDYFLIEYPKKIKKLDISKIIVVDTNIPDRLGEFKEIFTDPQVDVHIYDHHPLTAESVEGDQNNIEQIGATVTILLRQIRKKKIPITPLEATLFAIGIYEETGSLTFQQTTREDIEAAAYLLSKKANLKVVSDYVHHSLNNKQIHVLNTLINNAKISDYKGYKILITSAQVKEFIEEISLIVHRLVDVEGVDIAFALVRMKEKVFIIGRGREPEIDISKILSHLGGAGHAAAASAAIKNTTIEKCERQLLEAIEKEVKPLLLAKDIMSTPVRYIDLDEDKTILDAQKALVRFGHSGLVMLKDGKLAGILTRHDVDKAIHHGLAEANIEDYMLKTVLTAGTDTPIVELQKMMAEHDIGRIPIFKEGKMAGIVTRNDILTALHGVSAKKKDTRTDAVANIKQLPAPMQKLFNQCSSVATRLGVSIFLIGGFVRDLLLGIENLDLDIVVEGDGIVFARELARKTSSKLITHEKFKTAIVFTKHYKVDIASTRVEFYTRPAALPVVWASSIKQDLYRRDFSINALAVQLNKHGFGKIIDYFGGQRDLKDGIIRVLHTLSFVEDPTRIFRAVRFEQRYHFKMGHHTEQLLINAMHGNIFNELTNERIREEFILILSEEKPVAALNRMAQLHITKVIHHDICFNDKITEIMQEATSLIIKYKKALEKERAQTWVIYFMALISQLNTDKINAVVKKFKLTADTAQKIKLDKVEASVIIRKLSQKDITKSRIYRALRPLSIEEIIYLMARTSFISVRQKIDLYLTSLKNTKFYASGKDLIRWGYEPSPFFRRALTALEDAQIDGVIKSKAQAREYLEKNRG